MKTPKRIGFRITDGAKHFRDCRDVPAVVFKSEHNTKNKIGIGTEQNKTKKDTRRCYDNTFRHPSLPLRAKREKTKGRNKIFSLRKEAKAYLRRRLEVVRGQGDRERGAEKGGRGSGRPLGWLWGLWRGM